jgi:hypothetical protein
MAVEECGERAEMSRRGKQLRHLDDREKRLGKDMEKLCEGPFIPSVSSRL